MKKCFDTVDAWCKYEDSQKKIMMLYFCLRMW